MENRINKVFTLENGDKYMILKQAIYNNENYYVATLLDKDENLTEKFIFLHEHKMGGDLYVKMVTDPSLLSLLAKHLNVADNY